MHLWWANVKEEKARKTVIIVSIFVLLYFCFSIFVVQQPFMHKVTEGHPVIRFLCEAQLNCHSGVYQTSCDHPDMKRELWSWAKYKGCNNNTETFFTSDGYNYVRVERCSCSAIMV
jgi:hypothetical protein